ncbi:hypothetical protein AB0K40_37525 [Nonomuraea bangladeshensis]|uniref:Uncharacterized protein n=1 Tax=Nonomuraea bangladeshensis TaxID=404385 RepID=A0ABV3HFC3_9ACTN
MIACMYIAAPRPGEALGYGKDVTIDDRFSCATARAVQAWQKPTCLPQWP